MSAVDNAKALMSRLQHGHVCEVPVHVKEDLIVKCLVLNESESMCDYLKTEGACRMIVHKTSLFYPFNSLRFTFHVLGTALMSVLRAIFAQTIENDRDIQTEGDISK